MCVGVSPLPRVSIPTMQGTQVDQVHTVDNSDHWGSEFGSGYQRQRSVHLRNKNGIDWGK